MANSGGIWSIPAEYFPQPFGAGNYFSDGKWAIGGYEVFFMSPKRFQFEILATYRFVASVSMEFSGSGRQLKKSKGSLATKMSSSSKNSVDDGDGDGKMKVSDPLQMQLFQMLK